MIGSSRFRPFLHPKAQKTDGRSRPLQSRQLFSRGRARARSGNAPSNGAFPSSQVVKAPPRRGKAVWSAARFVCRMTLYACRSSSRKTRYAIFVGALKNKKALAHPSPRRSSEGKDLRRNASRNLFCAAKEIRELKSNPARRVPLRCGTQFASYLRLTVIRMTKTSVGVTAR